MSFTSPGSIGSRMPASEDTQLRKFADLERFVRELGPSIAKSFRSTVDSLNSTIAELTAQQVSAASGSGSGSGFAVDGASSTTTSFAVTTPTGYTRAVVLASGTVAVANGAATADYLYVKAVIAGSSGPEATVSVGAAGSGSLSASHALTVSGLTDGQSVTGDCPEFS